MGRLLREAMTSHNECRVAMLSEIEFAETARVLKTLAREAGHDERAVIDQLARHGLDAALGVMSSVDRTATSEAYQRHRARWRAGMNRPAVH